MFYTGYEDGMHFHIHSEHTSIFEATCDFYQLSAQLEEHEIAEMGEVDYDLLEGILFT